MRYNTPSEGHTADNYDAAKLGIMSERAKSFSYLIWFLLVLFHTSFDGMGVF